MTPLISAVASAWPNEPTDNFGLLVQHTQQSLETDGVFAYDPNLDGESSTTRFTPRYQSEDDFGLTTLTLNGRIGMLDMIYTVGYLDREMEAYIDYSDYTNGGGYQVYYLCPGYADDGTWARVGAAGTPVTCHDPEAQYIDNNDSTRVTQEIRVSMPDDYRMRVTAGRAFFDEQTTRGTASFEDAATRDDGDGSWPALGMIGDATEGTNAGGQLFKPQGQFL